MEASLRISFDSALFSADTVQRASLKFTDTCSFEFQLKDRSIDALVTLKNTAATLQSKEFEGLLRNEVLDQHLRSIIAKETENERNLILAYAFSNTKLIGT
jgi:His-Xaa-Ser system protein HxsD